MSKTCRAKSGDQWNAGFHGWIGLPGNPWQYADATVASYFHSDNPRRDGPCGQINKRTGNKRRRNHSRIEMKRILANPEHEFSTIERRCTSVHRLLEYFC